MTSGSDWQAGNLAAIEQRLAFLRDVPDGIIHERPGSMHSLLIRKVENRLELVFLGGRSSEIISDLVIDRPLSLFAGFTQAMMLGLLWKEPPARVYVLGFGAGRVPMVLYHYFPEVRIESTDIDPDVVAVAREYFGIVTDERQKVIVQDGREYLAELSAGMRYDIIMVDAFRGVGSSPVQLGTREFYAICKDHLLDDGVVVVNLMGTDELFHEKIRTIAGSFAAVYGVAVPEDGTLVLLASDCTAWTRDQLLDRARSIQARHAFSFPFLQHAERLQNIEQLKERWPWIRRAAELTDVSAPRILAGQSKAMPPSPLSAPPLGGLDLHTFEAEPLVRSSPRKVGRNDPCPCGSGKKYKKCCLRNSPLGSAEE
jgi:spermidine synthase